MLICISQDGIDHFYRQRIQPLNAALLQLELTANAYVLRGMMLDLFKSGLRKAEP